MTPEVFARNLNTSKQKIAADFNKKYSMDSSSPSPVTSDIAGLRNFPLKTGPTITPKPNNPDKLPIQKTSFSMSDTDPQNGNIREPLYSMPDTGEGVKKYLPPDPDKNETANYLNVNELGYGTSDADQYITNRADELMPMGDSDDNYQLAREVEDGQVGQIPDQYSDVTFNTDTNGVMTQNLEQTSSIKSTENNNEVLKDVNNNTGDKRIVLAIVEQIEGRNIKSGTMVVNNPVYGGLGAPELLPIADELTVGPPKNPAGNMASSYGISGNQRSMENTYNDMFIIGNAKTKQGSTQIENMISVKLDGDLDNFNNLQLKETKITDTMGDSDGDINDIIFKDEIEEAQGNSLMKIDDVTGSPTQEVNEDVFNGLISDHIHMQINGITDINGITIGFDQFLSKPNKQLLQLPEIQDFINVNGGPQKLEITGVNGQKLEYYILARDGRGNKPLGRLLIATKTPDGGMVIGLKVSDSDNVNVLAYTSNKSPGGDKTDVEMLNDLYRQDLDSTTGADNLNNALLNNNEIDPAQYTRRPFSAVTGTEKVNPLAPDSEIPISDFLGGNFHKPTNDLGGAAIGSLDAKRIEFIGGEIETIDGDRIPAGNQLIYRNSTSEGLPGGGNYEKMLEAGNAGNLRAQTNANVKNATTKANKKSYVGRYALIFAIVGGAVAAGVCGSGLCKEPDDEVCGQGTRYEGSPPPGGDMANCNRFQCTDGEIVDDETQCPDEDLGGDSDHPVDERGENVVNGNYYPVRGGVYGSIEISDKSKLLNPIVIKNSEQSVKKVYLFTRNTGKLLVKVIQNTPDSISLKFIGDIDERELDFNDVKDLPQSVNDIKDIKKFDEDLYIIYTTTDDVNTKYMCKYVFNSGSTTQIMIATNTPLKLQDEDSLYYYPKNNPVVGETVEGGVYAISNNNNLYEISNDTLTQTVNNIQFYYRCIRQTTTGNMIYEYTVNIDKTVSLKKGTVSVPAISGVSGVEKIFENRISYNRIKLQQLKKELQNSDIFMYGGTNIYVINNKDDEITNLSDEFYGNDGLKFDTTGYNINKLVSYNDPYSGFNGVFCLVKKTPTGDKIFKYDRDNNRFDEKVCTLIGYTPVNKDDGSKFNVSDMMNDGKSHKEFSMDTIDNLESTINDVMFVGKKENYKCINIWDEQHDIFKTYFFYPFTLHNIGFEYDDDYQISELLVNKEKKSLSFNRYYNIAEEISNANRYIGLEDDGVIPNSRFMKYGNSNFSTIKDNNNVSTERFTNYRNIQGVSYLSGGDNIPDYKALTYIIKN